MSGIFSTWQPIYAERGIATFPVGEAKKPCIRGWQRIGRKVSAELALKFVSADALGYVTGRRSNITVLDIDSADEKIAEDAIRRHGQPAVVTRTASGKRHLLYRYNGEGRRIRPWPELPIDVLGDNGYALAAPSKLATGNYEIIHGHLDDLDRLKPMQSGLVQSARQGGVLVPKGERNRALFDHCRQAARYCDSLEALIDCATTYRDNCVAKDPADPITDAEMIKTASSAWKMQIEGRNWIGQGGIIPMRFAELDRSLNLGADATFLFLHLKRHYDDRETFLVANAMAGLLQWRPRRFKDARRQLVEAGLLHLIHQGGRRPRDPSIYGWGNEAMGVKNDPQS
jgi:Bifunctional DNA primase/polymerase, N-terminal/Primase C terminal 1 (PriCT-1)